MSFVGSGRNFVNGPSGGGGGGSGGGGGGVLIWGQASIGATVDARFLTPGYGVGIAPLTNMAPIPAPRAGTLKSLFVQHSADDDADVTITYAVYVNGAPTLLGVALAAVIGSAHDTATNIVVAAGDLIAIEATKDGELATGALLINLSLELS